MCDADESTVEDDHCILGRLDQVVDIAPYLPTCNIRCATSGDFSAVGRFRAVTSRPEFQFRVLITPLQRQGSANRFRVRRRRSSGRVQLRRARVCVCVCVVASVAGSALGNEGEGWEWGTDMDQKYSTAL